MDACEERADGKGQDDAVVRQQTCGAHRNLGNFRQPGAEVRIDVRDFGKGGQQDLDRDEDGQMIGNKGDQNIPEQAIR